MNRRQGGHAGHRQQHESPADDGAGRLAPHTLGCMSRTCTTPVGGLLTFQIIATAHHHAHTDGDQHRRQEEPAPAQEVAHPYTGTAAYGTQRASVEGDGTEHAQRDQAHAPEIRGMTGGHRPHRGQQATGFPTVATRASSASALAGLVLLRWGTPARSRRGCRLALGPRCPGSTSLALGGGRHSALQATSAEGLSVGHLGSSSRWPPEGPESPDRRAETANRPRLRGDRQTVTMTGTIIGRCRVRSPTNLPRALRATLLSVS